jgi:diacylglycerol kinase (ATP)
VVGGDGALHELLPTLVAKDLTTAMIPAGSGNDVARQLGVHDPGTAIRAIHDGRTRAVDLLDVGDALVATVVASGFDSKVNERANTMTWPKGKMRYNRAVVAELRAFQPLSFTIEADSQTFHRDAMLVAVGNMPSFGGGLRIAEGAEDDDGLLDIIVIHPVSKLKLLRVFPMLYRGDHIRLPEFERIRAKEVTWHSPGIVAYGDGERLGPLPLTARVRPGALRMVHA